MVTQLPSTGKPGCDTSDMVMIHGLFRSVYAEAPALVAGVAVGDTARAAVVGDHVTGIADSLHHHHGTEDLLLWDQLEARNPACAAHVGQMRAHHSAMGAELEKLAPAVEAWKADPSKKNRDSAGAILARINALLLEHFGAEEKQILPVASAAFSQAEWDRLGEHSRASVPRDMQFIQLGFILDSMPESDRQVWFAKNLPAPIRLLYTLVGKKQYQKYRAALYG